MNKKMIALAIAGALVSPLAMADSGNVNIYGVLHMSIDNLKANDTAGNSDNKGWNVSSNSSRIGFKGNEDLGDGLKVNWQLEAGFDMDENTGVFASHRNSYMGLSGSWGEVRFGRHDTPYKLADGKARAMFDDTIADQGAIISAGAASGSTTGSSLWEGRVDNVMAYISPTWSGFHVAFAQSYYAGANGAAGMDGNKQRAYSLAAVYENGPFNAALGYETRRDTSAGQAAGGSAASDNAKATKLAFGYATGPFQVNLVWERQRADDSSAGDYQNRTNWALNGAYSFGSNRVIAEYVRGGESSKAGVNNSNTDGRLWAIGLEHTMSKRTNAYVMYAAMNNDTAGQFSLGASGHGDRVTAAAGFDQRALSLGLRHSF